MQFLLFAQIIGGYWFCLIIVQLRLKALWKNKWGHLFQNIPGFSNTVVIKPLRYINDEKFPGPIFQIMQCWNFLTVSKSMQSLNTMKKQSSQASKQASTSFKLYQRSFKTLSCTFWASKESQSRAEQSRATKTENEAWVDLLLGVLAPSFEKRKIL